MSKINGIVGILGGLVNVEVQKTFQLYPLLVVDYYLIAGTQPTEFTYESSDSAVATVGERTGIISGVTEGKAQITIRYATEEETFKDIIDVTVRPKGWQPDIPAVDDWAEAKNILKGKRAVVKGEEIIGTAEVYVEGTTLHVPEGLLRINED